MPHKNDSYESISVYSDQLPNMNSEMKFQDRVSDESCAYIILTTIKVMCLLFLVYVILLMPIGSALRWRKQSTVSIKVRSSQSFTKEFLCLLCDMCDVVTKIARDFFDWAEKTSTMVLDYLYMAKLKFYSFLSSIDHQDLCRQSRCCDLDSENGRFADFCYKCKKKMSLR